MEYQNNLFTFKLLNLNKICQVNFKPVPVYQLFNLITINTPPTKLEDQNNPIDKVLGNNDIIAIILNHLIEIDQNDTSNSYPVIRILNKSLFNLFHQVFPKFSLLLMLKLKSTLSKELYFEINSHNRIVVSMGELSKLTNSFQYSELSIYEAYDKLLSFPKLDINRDVVLWTLVSIGLDWYTKKYKVFDLNFIKQLDPWKLVLNISID